MNAEELKQAIGKLPDVSPDCGLVYLAQIEGFQRMIAEAERSIDRQKSLLLLKLQEDWSGDEICKALGEENVKKIILAYVPRKGNQSIYD